MTAGFDCGFVGCVPATLEKRIPIITSIASAVVPPDLRRAGTPRKQHHGKIRRVDGAICIDVGA